MKYLIHIEDANGWDFSGICIGKFENLGAAYIAAKALNSIYPSLKVFEVKGHSRILRYTISQ